jgi:hypothetical protein
MNRIASAALILILTSSFAAAADFASEVVEATFKLFHPSSVATCWLVRKEGEPALCLVTAAHALESIKGETAIIVLRRKKPDGTFERVDHTISIRREGVPRWVRHKEQDVAVLPLAEPVPTEVPAIALAALADEARLQKAGVHVASPLYVLTFPQRFEGNAAGFPVARSGIFATPPLLPMRSYPTFLADFTTFAGDSGGPVFIESADGHALIVGLAVAQNWHEDRMKSEFEDRTVRHPLGMGTVLHAQFIRETFAAAAQRDDPKK